MSDDNAFVESLFRTDKYRPEFTVHGFADLQTARDWAAQFVHWHNHAHLHSGIPYVSPAARHVGHEHQILVARHQVYERARQRHPSRWRRHTRNWQPIGAITLNPGRNAVRDAGAVARASAAIRWR